MTTISKKEYDVNKKDIISNFAKFRQNKHAIIEIPIAKLFMGAVIGT